MPDPCLVALGCLVLILIIGAVASADRQRAWEALPPPPPQVKDAADALQAGNKGTFSATVEQHYYDPQTKKHITVKTNGTVEVDS